MYVRLKIFKKGDNKCFRMVRNLSEEKAHFDQFLGLQKQPVVAADNLRRGENLSPLQTLTNCKALNEHLKWAQKTFEVGDWANKKDKKVWVNLLRYNVDKPDVSNAEVPFFARKKVDDKHEQIL